MRLDENSDEHISDRFVMNLKLLEMFTFSYNFQQIISSYFVLGLSMIFFSGNIFEAETVLISRRPCLVNRQ